MKKNDYCMMKPLSGEEHVQVSGGYVPPTEEQMEELRKIYVEHMDILENNGGIFKTREEITGFKD